ncbi:putative ribonuclease H-like domain-containing protein [Tanacetum coccineum]
MSQPANDDFSQHLSDDEASYHEDASDNGTATNKPKQQQQQQLTPTTTTISNIKLPILKKEEYDIWAMKLEHYLEYIENDVWKVIHNGNSKKRISTGKDGVVRVLPPVSAVEIHAKAILKQQRDRFGVNANSKKMHKAVLKQQFEAFTIKFRRELTSTSKSSASAQNAAFVSHSKSITNKVKSGHTGSLLTLCQTIRRFGLEQIYDMDIKEMDINWQIAMNAILMKKFYKKTGRRVQIDGNKPVGFDKKKLECFKCHNTGHFARECPSKGTNDGKKRDSFYQDQGARKKEQNQNCLLTMDDGVVNWGEHTEEEVETNPELMVTRSKKILAYDQAVKEIRAQVITFQKQQLSLNEQLTFQANELYEKDENLKRYRRIGMKAVKEKEQLQKTVDSWKDSSKNLWRLVDSGMSSTSKVGLGYEIKSNDEVLSYEEEMNSTVFNCTEEDFIDKPLYNRFSKTDSFKGVPHPLTGDYTPKPQQEIDESLAKVYITGKGRIRVGNLDFDSVSFVKELGHFNLFSISQICDKQHKVLFTETECLVVSPDFKMPDENQILLKVPRQHNMYSFDMKTPSLTKDYACLIAKATSDESKLWHRRLGHINFKNLNKLVKGNLVRGLPSKVFRNDHTCVACQKGKQHKASCKAKLERTITEPLHTLHMDLFGPTSVKSINHASYCLVITDDCTRFSWVFFLATKDETSGILQNFIRQIENQLNHRVKIIRSDNGTEFKNRDMLEFCGNKGIKQEYSNARTPQQNGVAERMNRTLIEAARTMLADSLLPTTFWAEAVSTACYIFNRVRVTKPQNKTPYELLFGHKPIISYIRPFGCHVTILDTLSVLGKFDGKCDEGFLVGYSLNSKAFRVYNLVTKKVEVNLHVKFLEEKPNVKGVGYRWMFDIDYLTDSMNYIPVSLENQPNPHADTSEVTNSAGTLQTPNANASEEEDEAEELIVVPTVAKHTAAKVGPRKSSTNSKAEESLIELQNLKTQEKEEPKKQQRNNHSKKEPKKISEALKDDSWVEAMQEELL